MQILFSPLVLSLCFSALLVTAMPSREEIKARQREIREKRAAMFASEHVARDTADAPPVKRASTITFSNPAAAAFHVPGTSLPDVDFDVGDSWSGLMPITSAAGETRKLFFWFWPSLDAAHTDDLVFWTNGGPGCSSLEGFLQENGPFSWPTGTAAPVPNQWGWNKLAHVIWVEQPVGTGFSQGTANITNENDLAAELAGFFQQFLTVFSELKGKNLFLAGESYAGFYVPYIANFLYTNPTAVDLKLQGIWITDPSLSFDLVQEHIPALPFVEHFKSVFAFPESFMATLRNASDACGFTNFMDKVTFPPKGPIALPPQSFTGTPASVARNCRLWDMIFDEASNLNPAFDIYRILDVWPILWDVLGFPGSFDNVQSPLYFNRTEVQTAIHAPHIEWEECSGVRFGSRDTSPPSALSVLGPVIDKGVRNVIMHGLVDFILIANGSRIAIQNMTWGGLQGFQTPIQPESFSINGFGTIGTAHTERKLSYVEVNLAGHMMPQFAPWAAFKTLSFLLGRIPSLNSTTIDASLFPNDDELFGRGPRSKRTFSRADSEL
ncbi:alpha/beta-hydrolase [Exidia glandulosa HHB12029]|uniref:Carboxypeptidase n=1 Tax=Exidia glandulosa HHB12029 TaxID=1314781 RepID=A0A165EJU2_EXIGL|nr:alpha/beta-hydrolase [Exidia glandulosa HHB12029]